MSAEIVINGRSVAESVQHKDASGSNYILVKTKGQPLSKAQRKELKDLDVEIQEFVGNETDQIYLCGYKPKSLVPVRQLDYIEYADIYNPAFVIPQEIANSNSNAGSHESEGPIEVDVLLHHDIDCTSETNAQRIDALAAKIADKAGLDASAVSIQDGFIRIKVDDPTKLESIASIDQVRVIHPTTEQKLFNNVARDILQVSHASHDDKVYTGKGQLVCVADTGFDRGSLEDVHDAFGDRVQKLYPWGRKAFDNADDPDGHGTHVCGSIIGSGEHSQHGWIEGTAPEAHLIVQSTFSRFDLVGRTVLGGIPKDLSLLFSQAYEAGARVHTNSWGTPYPEKGPQPPYGTTAEAIDKFIWEHQDMTILFAAGNDGQDSDLDGTVNERSLGAEASAKNCITVGASENNRPDLKSGKEGVEYTYGGFWQERFSQNPLKDDHQANNPEGLAAFSSRGPTAENRMKPDIVAPGTAILSTRSRNKKFVSNIKKTGVSGDDRYMYLSGTSMATPLVAGCCAVIRQCLMSQGYQDVENGNVNPTGSLIKALLITGAVAIKGQYMPENIGNEPNPHAGFGRVDLAASLIKPNDPFMGYGIGQIVEDEDVNADDSITIDVPVPRDHSADDKQLTFKATLVYADRPGGALSLDLNLCVIAGDKQRHGNQVGQEFNVGATEPFDRRNNVEQVVWPSVPGDSVKLKIIPYRLLDVKVPFAYAWKFY